jgi:hypothetical protein
MKSQLANVEIPARVVFLNLKDSHVFFDCSPAEARAAMEHVEDFRKRKITLPELKEKVDKMRALVDECKKRVVTIENSGSELTVMGLNKAFALVEQQDRRVDGLLMCAKDFASVRNWGKTIYDEATRAEVLSAGIFAHIWTSFIVISNKIKKGNFYLVSLLKEIPGINGKISYEDNPYVLKFKLGNDMRKQVGKLDPEFRRSMVKEMIKNGGLKFEDVKELLEHFEKKEQKRASDLAKNGEAFLDNLGLDVEKERKADSICDKKIDGPLLTSIERKVLTAIRRLQDEKVFPPYRDYPCYSMSMISDPMTISIAYPTPKVAIMCDGTIFHGSADQKKRDNARDKQLAEMGWTVLRFSEDEINSDLSDVLKVIKYTLENPNKVADALKNNYPTDPRFKGEIIVRKGGDDDLKS